MSIKSTKKDFIMKKLGFIGLVLLLLVELVGCNKEGQVKGSEKFCSYLNIENILMTNPLRASICHMIEIQMGYNHWYSGKVTKEVTVQLKEK